MSLGEEDSKTIASVGKMFDIIEVIKTRGGATLAEVEAETGIPKSTVHVHMNTLRERGLVVFDGERYHLGSQFLDVGLRYREAKQTYSVAKPKIDELANKTGEDAACFIEEQGWLVNLYSAGGDQAVKVYRGKDTKVGQRKHIHISACGKAILAELPDARITEIIEQNGLPSYTPETITDRDELFDELKSIRKQGYAYNIEEGDVGRNGIGAVISENEGEIIGAIGISGPANRLTTNLLENRLAEVLIGATNEIRLNLKYK